MHAFRVSLRVVLTCVMVLAVSWAVVGVTSAWAAAAVITGGQLFANGSDVVVTLTPTGAGFTSDIFLFTPGGGFLGTNRDAVTKNLGAFPIGTELLFGIFVRDTSTNYYAGPACRNPDGVFHDQVEDIGGGQLRIGFEDLNGGGDLSFNDAILEVSGVDVFGPFGDCHGAGHFMCYTVKATKGNVCSSEANANVGATCETESDCGGIDDDTDFCVPNKLDLGPKSVSVADNIESKLFDFKKPAALCNPAAKKRTDIDSIEGIDNTVTHLESNVIVQTKTKPPQPKFVQTIVSVNHQFGELELQLLKPDRLLVPTTKQHGGTSPPAPPDTGDPLVDHFKCYKTKVISAEASQITVRVLDQFSQEKDLDLKKPIRFCESADKNGEGRTDPNAKLVCYKAVPHKGQPKHVKVKGLFINNQFGPDELDTVKESEFCIPAFDIPTPG
jgi:hypothetical protein